MSRLPALLCLAALAVPAAAEDDPRLKEALAFQAVRKEAIRKAEPAIACVLVSRSELYRRDFNDTPPADEPGRLGGFRTRSDSTRRLDLADPSNIPESYGSGVVIDGGKGLVLTNYHVVRDAAKVFIRLPGGRGSYADIYAADPRSDLAVLRLLDLNLLPVPEIKFGDGGGLEKGDAVLTLANPFAAGFRDGSPSVSAGMVSNLRRRAPGNPREEERYRATLHQSGTLLQIDARLNLGCSGGAVVNLKGELVGLITALAAISGSETPGGYAVPLDAAMKRIIGQLRQGKEVEYGFLGIRPYAEVRPEGGVRLEAVTENSPAWNAGLRRDSVILKINDQPVRDFDDLFVVIGPQLAGSEVRLEVDAEPRHRTVTLAKFAVPTEKVIASNRSAPRRGLRVDYTSVLLMRQSAMLNRLLPGVLVREVVPGSPAYRAKLQVDKIITQVNGRAVNTPAEFYAAMDENNQAPIELTLLSPEGLPDKVRLDVR